MNFNEIKEKITAYQAARYIADSLGEYVHKRGKDYFVSSKENSENGSIHVSNTEKGVIVHEFSGKTACNGDIFDVIKVLDGYTGKDALKKAAEIANIPYIEENTENQVKTAQKVNSEAVFNEFLSKYKDELRQGLSSPAAKNILFRRGVSECVDKIECFGYATRKIILPQNIIEQGVFVFWSNSQKTFKTIRFDETTGKRTKKISMLRGARELNFECITKPFDTPLFLVEGEIDALSMCAMGYNAIACKDSSGIRYLKRKFGGYSGEWVLGYDADPAGVSYTARCLIELKTGRSISKVWSEFGADPNDFLCFGGVSIDEKRAKINTWIYGDVEMWASSLPSSSSSSLPSSSSSSLARARAAMEKTKIKRETKDGVKYEYLKGDASTLLAWLRERDLSLDEMSEQGYLIGGKPLSKSALIDEQIQIIKGGCEWCTGRNNLLYLEDCARKVCEENAFNPVTKWLNDLPSWDGIDRVSTFFERYCGAIGDSEYLQSVSRYMWSALAGRPFSTTDKPIQCDSCILLHGATGTMKTSMCRAVCIDGKYFFEAGSRECNNESEWERKLRFSQVCEIGEMKQSNDRTLQLMKRILTSTTFNVRRLHSNDFDYYPNRSFTFATCDRDEVLADGAGNRRFIPVEIGGVIPDKQGKLVIDIAAIERDKKQLYAQGLALFREHGIMWSDIKEDVRAEQAKSLADVDERATIATEWASKQVREYFSLQEIWSECLQGRIESLDRKTMTELGNSLRLCGWVKKDKCINGKGVKRWFKPSSNNDNDCIDPFAY